MARPIHHPTVQAGRLPPPVRRLMKAGATAAAALFLLAQPGPAQAQWWEDDDAFYDYGTEGVLSDYDYYPDYGYYGDTAALGSEEYYDEMEELTDEYDDTAAVSESTEDYYNELEERSDLADNYYDRYGYYGNELYDDEEWGDWW